MNLYSIYDEKANLHVVIFQSNTDNEAERRFVNLLTTPEQSIFVSNPADFKLLCFGSVDSLNYGLIRHGNEYSPELLQSKRISQIVSRETIISKIKEKEVINDE